MHGSADFDMLYNRCIDLVVSTKPNVWLTFRHAAPGTFDCFEFSLLNAPKLWWVSWMKCLGMLITPSQNIVCRRILLLIAVYLLPGTCLVSPFSLCCILEHYRFVVLLACVSIVRVAGSSSTCACNLSVTAPVKSWLECFERWTTAVDYYVIYTPGIYWRAISLSLWLYG